MKIKKDKTAVGQGSPSFICFDPPKSVRMKDSCIKIDDHNNFIVC